MNTIYILKIVIREEIDKRSAYFMANLSCPALYTFNDIKKPGLA